MTRDSISDESRHARNVFWSWRVGARIYPLFLSHSLTLFAGIVGRVRGRGGGGGGRRTPHPLSSPRSALTDHSQARIAFARIRTSVQRYTMDTGGGRLSFSHKFINLSRPLCHHTGFGTVYRYFMATFPKIRYSYEQYLLNHISSRLA